MKIIPMGCCAATHSPGWIRAPITLITLLHKTIKGNQLHLGLWGGPDLVGALPGFTSGVGPARVFGSPLRGAMTSYMGPIGLDLGGRGRLLDPLNDAPRQSSDIGAAMSPDFRFIPHAAQGESVELPADAAGDGLPDRCLADARGAGQRQDDPGPATAGVADVAFAAQLGLFTSAVFLIRARLLLVNGEDLRLGLVLGIFQSAAGGGRVRHL